MAWLLSPQQTTPAPGQKCAAEYLGQHQPALQHCSTAALQLSILVVLRIKCQPFSPGWRRWWRAAGSTKVVTAALQHCRLTQSPRPAAQLSTFLSIGRAKNCSSSQQLCSSLCGPCSTAALQLWLSRKFREMFTIFLEGVLSCPVHTKNLLA